MRTKSIKISVLSLLILCTYIYGISAENKPNPPDAINLHIISRTVDQYTGSYSIHTYVLRVSTGDSLPFYDLTRNKDKRFHYVSIFRINKIIDSLNVLISYRTASLRKSGCLPDTTSGDTLTISTDEQAFAPLPHTIRSFYNINVDTSYQIHDTLHIESLPYMVETTEEEKPINWAMPVEVYYENGQIKEKYIARFNDKWRKVKHGKYRKWAENGQLLSEIDYDMGKNSGQYHFYHDNGAKRLEGEWQSGYRHGDWHIWDEHGKLLEYGQFHKGTGHMKYANGNKKLYIEHKDGIKQGTWKEWYPSGLQKLETKYKNGYIFGSQKTWYENGKLESYKYYLYKEPDPDPGRGLPMDSRMRIRREKHGLMHGKWRTWYESGQIKDEIRFNHGKRIGNRIEWYENVQRKNREKITGSSVIHIEYYSTGQMSSHMEKIGNRASVKTYWYDSGELMKEETVARNLKHGLFTEWYKNGKVKLQGEHEWNDPSGNWLEYYPSGNLFKAMKWHNRYLKHEFHFNESYKKIAEGDMGRYGHKDGEWFYWDETGNLIKKELWIDKKLHSSEDIPIDSTKQSELSKQC